MTVDSRIGRCRRLTAQSVIFRYHRYFFYSKLLGGGMPSPVRRRDVLQAGGALAIGSLAGCSYLQGDSIFTSIDIGNFHTQDLSVEVRVYDPDTDDRDDRLLFYSRAEMNQFDAENGVDRELAEDAFESQKAVVQLDIGVQGGDDLVQEFTYFPESHHCRQEAIEEHGHHLKIDLYPHIGRTRMGCGPTS